MKNHPPHLQIIGQLAQEYDGKYRELEKRIAEIPPDSILSQLSALADRTTDHFRAAQIALLSIPESFVGEEGEKALQALTSMCRAFDEMRILFHFLVQTDSKAQMKCE
jgi:hypothetical protein